MPEKTQRITAAVPARYYLMLDEMAQSAGEPKTAVLIRAIELLYRSRVRRNAIGKTYRDDAEQEWR